MGKEVGGLMENELDAATEAGTRPAGAQRPRPQLVKGKKKPMKVKPNDDSLRLRLPSDEVTAIKVEAAKSNMTIAQYVLAAVHAQMKGKRGK